MQTLPNKLWIAGFGLLLGCYVPPVHEEPLPLDAPPFFFEADAAPVVGDAVVVDLSEPAIAVTFELQAIFDTNLHDDLSARWVYYLEDGSVGRDFGVVQLEESDQQLYDDYTEYVGPRDLVLDRCVAPLTDDHRTIVVSLQIFDDVPESQQLGAGLSRYVVEVTWIVEIVGSCRG